MEQTVEIIIMSDGSIKVTGPEPVARTLQEVLEIYFAQIGVMPSDERIEGLRKLLMDTPEARIERYQ